MPELPEVAALAGFLDEHATGRDVVRVDVASVQVLKTYDPPVTAMHARRLTAVRRHGKFLDLDADGLHMVVHLARAGWLHWREAVSAAVLRPGRGPIALRAVLSGGVGFDLLETGTKKRLSVSVVTDPAEVPGIARLGIDPLSGDFTAAALAALLSGRRTQIKGLLRDQQVIAGIGNAYSDEVLHAAKMSPFKVAATFGEADVARLHEAITGTLAEAVANNRGLAAGQLKAHKRENLRVHGRAGQACDVCGDTIREVSFADSALQYCPTCQTGGKPLADRRLSRLLK